MTVIVLACPRTEVFVEIAIEEARAIGVRSHLESEVTVWVATIPPEEQVAEIFPAAMLFVPFALCGTVAVPNAIFADWFRPAVNFEETE